jgi:hypothetical protein
MSQRRRARHAARPRTPFFLAASILAMAVGGATRSSVPLDDVLIQGDCGGTLHAFDISKPFREPPELWSLSLGSCIESTPSVLEDRIWVGTRGGGVYGIADSG